MTGQKRDIEEVLSLVLHSETDHVEPVGDGLTKIQARLSEPWLKRQWWLLRTEFVMLGWVVGVRCQYLFGTVRDRSEADGTVAAGADLGRRMALIAGGVTAWVSGKGDPRRPPGPVMNWLRPALAVAGAVVLVVAGVFALGQIRESIQAGLSAGGYTPGNSSHNGGAGVPSGRGGHSAGGGALISPRNGAARPGTAHHTGAHASASPCVTPSASPGSATPSPTPPPPTPTPTPTTSPTTSPTPSTTPTPSNSLAPAISPQALTGQDVDGIATTALMCGPAPGPTPSNQASPA